jgi:Uncharacterised nucleotidyltransferase
MAMGKSPRNFLPTPLQRDLLRVALGTPEDADRTWTEFRPRFSLDTLEPGAFELMPLVHRALTEANVEEPLRPRLRGIYRRAGVRNTLQLERTRRTAAVLEAAAIPALFLQGAVIAERFYPDLGLRPTGATHVLVEAEWLESAVWRALRVGWGTRADVSEGPDGRRYLFDDEGSVCVLQPTVEFDFVSRSGETSGTRLWECAEQQRIGGGRADVPSAADALLVTIVSGARTGAVPSIQWIADAAMIARSAVVDWSRIVDLATEYGQVIRVRDALETLGYLDVLETPPGVRAALSRARPTRRERVVYRCTTAPRGRLGAFPEIVAQHLAGTMHESTARTVATFPSRLRERWRLDSTWEVPVAAGRRAFGLLTGRRTWTER